MSYAAFAEYAELYPNGAGADDYARLSWEADRIIDRHTTGLDNVRKLQVAMPTDEYSLAAVKHCACALANLLYQIETVENSAVSAAGSVTRSDGLVVGKQVASMSSGSESISYSVSTAATTTVGAAVASEEEREKLFTATVRKYLSGVTDANGMNLLYMGVYPLVL